MCVFSLLVFENILPQVEHLCSMVTGGQGVTGGCGTGDMKGGKSGFISGTKKCKKTIKN